MPQSNTQLDIQNMALAAILQKPIGTAGETNERARLSTFFYDPMRRELLRMCEWTFAKKEIVLNLLGSNLSASSGVTGTGASDSDADDNPNPTQNNTVFPYAFIYQYPPSCSYIVKIYSEILTGGFDWNYEDPDDMWWYDRLARRGDNQFEIIRTDTTNELAIATNLQNAMCKFIFDTVDTSQFDPLFVTALSLKIAQRICLPLTGDKELKAQVDQDLEKSEGEAKRLNLSESPNRGPRESSFERTRGIS